MTGYPWAVGDALLATDLNDAIANATYVSDIIPPGGSIQAALDALPATGGEVRLSPNTTYTLTSGLITTKPNVTIEAPGWNTIVKRAVGVTGHLIDARGDNFVLRNVTVDGDGAVNTAGSFEVSVGGVNSLVRHCRIINAGGQGHLALIGAGSRAEGNTIAGLGMATPTRGGYGIWAIAGVKTFITANNISGTAIDAIGFDGVGTQVIGNYIAGCQCYAELSTTGGGQIAQYKSTTGSPPGHPDTLIMGNVVARGGGGFSSGLELNGPDVSVIGNIIMDQTAGGINVNAGSESGFLFSGNAVFNNGQAATGQAALRFNPPLGNIIVIGNRFADTQATHTQWNGIYFVAGTYTNVIISGNDLTGNINLGLQFVSPGPTVVVANNLGVANAPGVPTVNAVNDAAAASAGVGIGGEYRNGSIIMRRVA